MSLVLRLVQFWRHVPDALTTSPATRCGCVVAADAIKCACYLAQGWEVRGRGEATRVQRHVSISIACHRQRHSFHHRRRRTFRRRRNVRSHHLAGGCPVLTTLVLLRNCKAALLKTRFDWWCCSCQKCGLQSVHCSWSLAAGTPETPQPVEAAPRLSAGITPRTGRVAERASLFGGQVRPRWHKLSSAALLIA